MNYSIDSILCNSQKPPSTTPQEENQNIDERDNNVIFDQLRDSGCMNPNLQPKITSDNKVKLEPVREPLNKYNAETMLRKCFHSQSSKGTKEVSNPQKLGKNLPIISDDKVYTKPTHHPEKTSYSKER